MIRTVNSSRQDTDRLNRRYMLRTRTMQGGNTEYDSRPVSHKLEVVKYDVDIQVDRPYRIT